MNLQAANLTGANLTGASLVGANLNKVTWSISPLNGAFAGPSDGLESLSESGSRAMSFLVGAGLIW